MKVISIGEPGTPVEEPSEAGAGDSGAGAARAEPASTVVIGLFLLAVLYTCYFARALLLPVVLALLFALLLSPVVRVLRRCRLPEPAGAAIVMACLLGGIGVGVYTLTDPATEWLAKMPGSLRTVESKLRKLKQPVADVQRAAERLEAIAQVAVPGNVREVVLQRPGLRDLLAARTPYVLAGALSTVVLLYFLLASGDLFLRKVVRILPGLRNKIQAVEVGRTIQQEIGR
jgi:predicted PurR-regulated permease PerM